MPLQASLAALDCPAAQAMRKRMQQKTPVLGSSALKECGLHILERSCNVIGGHLCVHCLEPIVFAPHYDSAFI